MDFFDRHLRLEALIDPQPKASGGFAEWFQDRTIIPSRSRHVWGLDACIYALGRLGVFPLFHGHRHVILQPGIPDRSARVSGVPSGANRRERPLERASLGRNVGVDTGAGVGD